MHPQESTRSSPFKLVYARDVRSPLELLKGPTEEEKDDQATYVMWAQERLEKSRRQWEWQQQEEKQWYNRKARQSLG